MQGKHLVMTASKAHIPPVDARSPAMAAGTLPITSWPHPTPITTGRAFAPALNIPSAFLPLTFTLAALCTIDLVLANFATYHRHNLYAVGASFVVQALLVIISLALCVMLATATPAFQHGLMQSVAGALKLPMCVAAAYAVVVAGVRGYQLSVFATCWAKPCPALELEQAGIVSIWSPVMVASHVGMKMGAVVYYASVACIVYRILLLCCIPSPSTNIATVQKSPQAQAR